MYQIGWAILDKNDVVARFLPKRSDFFGAIIERENIEYVSELLQNIDRDWAGLAPHRIIEVFAEEQ